MSFETSAQRVCDFLSRRLAMPITLDSRLTADLGLDSMGFLLLVCDFEEEFGLSVPDEDLASLFTLRDVVVLLGQHDAC